MREFAAVQRLQAANSRVKVDLKRFVSFPDVQKKSPKKKSAAGKKGDESGEASAFPDLLVLLRQRTLQRVERLETCADAALYEVTRVHSTLSAFSNHER